VTVIHRGDGASPIIMPEQNTVPNKVPCLLTGRWFL